MAKVFSTFTLILALICGKLNTTYNNNNKNMPGFLENPFEEAFLLEKEELTKEPEKKSTDKQKQPESEEV